MIKDSPGKKQVVVAIIAVILAVAVGAVLVVRSLAAKEGAQTGQPEVFDLPKPPAMPAPVPQKDSVPVRRDTASGDSAKQATPIRVGRKASSRKTDTVRIVRVDTVVKFVEPISVEERLKLHKPSRPDQIPEYLRLVYHAMTIAAATDKDKAIRWGEEGLEFSSDGAILAFIAQLRLQQGRKWDAQVQAEKAINSGSILTTNYRDIASRVISAINADQKPISTKAGL